MAIFHIKNFNLSTDQRVNITERVPSGPIKRWRVFRTWWNSPRLQVGTVSSTKRLAVNMRLLGISVYLNDTSPNCYNFFITSFVSDVNF